MGLTPEELAKMERAQSDARARDRRWREEMGVEGYPAADGQEAAALLEPVRLDLGEFQRRMAERAEAFEVWKRENPAPEEGCPACLYGGRVTKPGEVWDERGEGYECAECVAKAAETRVHVFLRQVPVENRGITRWADYRTPSAGYEQAVAAAKLVVAEKVTALTLTGPSRAGKTQLAVVATCEAIRAWGYYRTAEEAVAGFTSGRAASHHWGRGPGIAQAMRRAMGTRGGEEGVLSGMTGAGLLVLDDLGKCLRTEYEVQRIWEVVEERVSFARPLIVTLNQSLDTVAARMNSVGGDLEGTSMARRLKDGGTVVELGRRR